MTWIEVADSAVKIGLGALITGIIAFVLSTIQHRNDRKKAKVAREFEMLKEVAGKVETFNRVSLRYWANITDWRARSLLSGIYTKPEKLIDSQNALYDSFSELTEAESLLLLFGYEEASISLRLYGETVIAFKKRVDSTDLRFDADDAANYRESMINKRAELFKILNNIYKKI
ncbi:hypothetical protein [Psychrobacter sp. Pi2-1]|uniref:hypothetical protein n=1 Tax=Psychrobacter sp. Pi2-1 TaxID=2774131 RepID=UPI001919230D|nr:hypothetical protein [Psychrobacter sp. Pi2-1]